MNQTAFNSQAHVAQKVLGKKNDSSEAVCINCKAEGIIQCQRTCLMSKALSLISSITNTQRVGEMAQFGKVFTMQA